MTIIATLPAISPRSPLAHNVWGPILHGIASGLTAIVTDSDNTAIYLDALPADRRYTAALDLLAAIDSVSPMCVDPYSADECQRVIMGSAAGYLASLDPTAGYVAAVKILDFANEHESGYEIDADELRSIARQRIGKLEMFADRPWPTKDVQRNVEAARSALVAAGLIDEISHRGEPKFIGSWRKYGPGSEGLYDACPLHWRIARIGYTGGPDLTSASNEDEIERRLIDDGDVSPFCDLSFPWVAWDSRHEETNDLVNEIIDALECSHSLNEEDLSEREDVTKDAAWIDYGCREWLKDLSVPSLRIEGVGCWNGDDDLSDEAIEVCERHPWIVMSWYNECGGYPEMYGDDPIFPRIRMTREQIAGMVWECRRAPEPVEPEIAELLADRHPQVLTVEWARSLRSDGARPCRLGLRRGIDAIESGATSMATLLEALDPSDVAWLEGADPTV